MIRSQLIRILDHFPRQKKEKSLAEPIKATYIVSQLQINELAEQENPANCKNKKLAKLPKRRTIKKNHCASLRGAVIFISAFFFMFIFMGNFYSTSI